MSTINSRRRHRPWWIVAAFALALIAGCGGSDDDSTGADDEAPEASAPTESTADSTPDESDDAPLAPDATELSFGGPVAAGTYQTDIMGTPLTLDLADEWIAPAGSPGGAVFVDPATETETSEVVLLARIAGLPTAEEAVRQPRGPTFDGPPDDLDAWIDGVGEFEITNRAETNVGGADATVLDLRLSADGTKTIPGGCGPTADDRCVFVASTRSDALAFFIVRTSEVYRLWLIDQGSEDPIMVVAIATEANPAWLDGRGQAFVDGLTLGQPQPHPVPPVEGPAWEAGFSAVVPSGTQTFPALNGVSIDVPSEIFVIQDGNCLVFEPEYAGDSPLPPNASISLILQVGFAEPAPLTSVDQFLDLYEEGAQPQPTGETVEVLGYELAGYRVDGAFTDAPPPESRQLNCSAELGNASNLGYLPAVHADLWIGPADTGLLIISASAFTPEEQAGVKPLLDQLLPTVSAAG